MDVVHAGDIGLAGAADAAILARAAKDKRTLVTLDANPQAALAASGAKAPSVLRIRRQTPLPAHALVAVIEAVYAEVAIDLAAGAIVTVSDTALRLRRLPIARNK